MNNQTIYFGLNMTKGFYNPANLRLYLESAPFSGEVQRVEHDSKEPTKFEWASYQEGWRVRVSTPEKILFVEALTLGEGEPTKPIQTIVDYIYQGDLDTEIKLFERYKRKCAKRGLNWWPFFNNFVTRLPSAEPCGTTRSQIERYLPERLTQKPTLDLHHVAQNYSIPRRNQTLGEFYATIDQALEETGVLAEVRDLPKTSSHCPKIHELVLPAYQKLRRKGYLAYPDLTS